MNSALVPGALIKESREERLERWMQQYGNAILHTCFITLSDAHLAEDAMQDTFVKAWRAMDQFEQKFSAIEKPWLLRIALNTCRDYRRGAWFRRVNLTAEMEKLPAPLIGVSQEERELFLDVMALPEKYRQMILLHYYQQLTLREISEMLHLSISTIHGRLKKAEGMLRSGLEGRELIHG